MAPVLEVRNVTKRFPGVLANAPDSQLAQLMHTKLLIVGALTLFTAVHMYIAFKTHGIERTPLQNFVSRGSSMAIFLLNLVIIWYAIGIRDLL